LSQNYDCTQFNSSKLNITTPILLIDEEKCRRNIEKMVSKARSSQAILRPHFKTHHSAKIASWYRDAGVKQCTVSSVSMGHYFASHGWNDITIAFPYNLREAQEIDELAAKTDLNILLESTESLEHAKTNLRNTLGYFIKLDVGTHRTGIDPMDHNLIQELIQGATEQLKFQGFLVHAGHTYGARGTHNIVEIFNQVKKVVLPLRDQFGGTISFGDTPSCSTIDDLSMYDELRPGNFVFYDWMQKEISSCTIDEIAVCMAVPVVAKHPEREEIVVLGGAVHLSKDSIEENGIKSFGKAVLLKKYGWETDIIGNVVRLSQEHGIVHLDKKWMDKIKIGDLIGIIPVHSCLAADLQGHYLSTNGERIDKIIKN